MQTVGIDIGTTTISGVVLEKNGTQKPRILKAKTIENGSFLTTTKDWERIQDAEKIVKKSRQMLDDFLDEYPEVEKIGLTGQMHGIVYIDKEGTCVSPLYTWQDARGSLCEENNGSLTEEIQQTCNVQVASGYGIVTHIYNLRHHLIPDTAVSFCTIMDYFGMQLTGRKKAMVHASNGASFGFFNVQKNAFMTEELYKMGVEEQWLPQVCTRIEALGSYRERIVTTAIGDNQASFLGAAGNENNTLLVNMGTGGQISVLSDQYFTAEGISKTFLTWYLPACRSFSVRRKSVCTAGKILQRICERGNRTGETSVQNPGETGRRRESILHRKGKQEKTSDRDNI